MAKNFGSPVRIKLENIIEIIRSLVVLLSMKTNNILIRVTQKAIDKKYETLHRSFAHVLID